VFVVTHRGAEPVQRQGGTTFYFVTDGIESALAHARDAAGDKDVAISGGASVIQQFLAAGLVEEFQIHIAPVFLGSGVRLFADGQPPVGDPAITRVLDSPAATHLRYELG
jgi:dihydrofolate reductase